MVGFVDLAGHVEEGQPVYPGHETTQFWPSSTHEESGYVWKLAAGETDSVKRKLKAKERGSTEEHPVARTMVVNEHGPTHIDAFTHLDPTEDRSIDVIGLERFYGDAVGVDVSHVDPTEYITVDVLEGSLGASDVEVRDGDAITLHTGHRAETYGVDDPADRHAYVNDYTGLDEEATNWLADRGVENIGIDAPSIDHSDVMDTKEYAAHNVCLERDVLNMENMANLNRVAGTRYTLCAFPLKIRDGTASPIRPVAILPD